MFLCLHSSECVWVLHECPNQFAPHLNALQASAHWFKYVAYKYMLCSFLKTSHLFLKWMQRLSINALHHDSASNVGLFLLPQYVTLMYVFLCFLKTCYLFVASISKVNWLYSLNFFFLLVLKSLPICLFCTLAATFCYWHSFIIGWDGAAYFLHHAVAKQLSPLRIAGEEWYIGPNLSKPILLYCTAAYCDAIFGFCCIPLYCIWGITAWGIGHIIL